MATTFTQQQKDEIESVLRENRNDARDEMSEIEARDKMSGIEEGSEKWWALKAHETKLNSLLMFGSWDEKNEAAQVVRK